MKTYFLALYLCLSIVVLQAQVPQTEDSLATFLKTQPKDTLYIWAIRPYALIQIYEKADLKKADSLSKVQKSLAEKLNYGRGIYFSYMLQAIISQQKSDYQKMLENFQKCYEIVMSHKLNKYLQEASLNNISVAYDGLGNLNEAMKYAMMAIEVQEKNNLPKMDSAPYQMVGNVLKHNKKYKEALQYYQKSLAIDLKKENLKGISISENKIGNVYDDLENQKEALKHYKIGYDYALKAKYLLLQTDLLSNLGRMEIHFKNYTAAEKYLLKNEQLCKNLENEQALQTTYLDLGNLYQAQKKYKLAEKHFLQAKSLFKTNTNHKINQQISENLSEYYAETADYRNAYQNLIEANISRDSVFKIESQELTQDLLAKYETEKKETQIKLLDEEAKNANFQRNSLLIGGILSILLAVFVVFSLQNRNKLKRLEETQRLRNRIAADLHDEIGSTLSSISILSEIVAFQQKKNEFKPEIMLQVSNDAREVIDKMDDIIWTINPENDAFYNLETRLKSFAIPLFESKDIEFKFDFSTELESVKIDMGKRRDIYLIMKEAINNLVKYSQCKNAIIAGKTLDNKLIMSVIDDGIGFDNSADSLRNGQKNMSSRANKIGADLKIESKIGHGTSIDLSITI